MVQFRSFLAFVLAAVLAAYGSAATASAHAHINSGFHSVHVEADHHHEEAAYELGDFSEREGGHSPGPNPVTPAPDHHESGFHTHGAPQFTPVEAITVVAAAVSARQTLFLGHDRLTPNARDESPFKPPRTLL